MKFFQVFSLLILLILLNSCDKETNEFPSYEELECFGLTSSEIDSIGIIHNQYLYEVSQTVGFSTCIECRDSIILAFKALNVDVSGLGISLDSLIDFAVEIYDNFESNDLRYWTTHPFSQTTYSILTEIIDIIDESISYSNLEIQLDSLKSSVSSNITLNCLDKEILLASIEVAKKSYYLWAPQSFGGIGISFTGSNSVQSRWSWRRAIASDVASAAADMFALAGVLIATTAAPPANAAIFLGIGISSAVGSALGGI